jgi:purine-binding chemotaxis protein CheW
LARQPSRGHSAGDYLQVVQFRLAHEHYGIEVKYVREVCPLKDLTPLPGTPAFILGLTNVRGQVLSIIDVKKLFDLPDKGLTDLDKVMILQARGTEMGVLADAVLGVEPVAVQEIQPSLPTLTGVRERYLQGVTRDSVVLLDAEKLLSVGQSGWGLERE